MHLELDKEHWIRDKKEQFPELKYINLELMDKYKDYFIAFMDSPIDIFDGAVIEVKSLDFYNEDVMKLELDSLKATSTNLALYYISVSDNGIVTLRFAIIQ